MFDVIPVYQPRFISKEKMIKLINLYHLAKCALSGTDSSKYKRMLWACAEFNKEYPEISGIAVYKDLSAQLEGW